ncbi:adenylylsulfatase HINT3-like isoform X3 [Brassica napus]|uniref:adenylylsulfatase HINT3-like isoform X3 n=1 Tax=Brassica napus TaxID=3708 RepID=UPI0006AA965E|nr:adenylylsulfatase HINT3-like isoform X3 [Brassica napus]
MEARRLAILCSHLNPSSPYPTRGSILGASDCTSGSSEDEKVESSNLQNDCVFCKIVRGESPCIKLYEDDMCLCILDTSPLIHGHSLIIPKLHYPTLEQTPPSVVAAMCSKVPLISNAIVKATDSDSFNLLVNNGAAAGQVIFHSLRRQTLKLDKEATQLAFRVREQLCRVPEVQLVQPSS